MLNISQLAKNLGNMKGLKKLYLGGTIIRELPSSFERLIDLTWYLELEVSFIIYTLIGCCAEGLIVD